MLNEEDLSKIKTELKEGLSALFWDLADKHSADTRPGGHQVFHIIQDVLLEFSSNIECQTGKMAPLTNRQKDHICYQIGVWYFNMKPLFEVQHNLGHMKEKLKNMICQED